MGAASSASQKSRPQSAVEQHDDVRHIQHGLASSNQHQNQLDDESESNKREIIRMKQQLQQAQEQHESSKQQIFQLQQQLQKQVETSQRLIAQLEQQLNDVKLHCQSQNAEVCAQNDQLRILVSDLEAKLLKSSHSTDAPLNAACAHGIVTGQHRRNEQYLRDVYNRFKDATGGLSGQNLIAALAAVESPTIPTSEQTVDTILQFDVDRNKTLEFGEFQQLVNEPDELQLWFSDKHVPLAADAFRALVGHGNDQLYKLSQLSLDEVDQAAAALCAATPSTLRQLHKEIQTAFAIQSKMSADMQANPSKFNDSFKLACGSIADFHKGLTGRVGLPHLNFKNAMRLEHCEKAGCDIEFTTGNYKITTKPKCEWQYVVGDASCPAKDMGHHRRIVPVSELLQRKVCRDANLREEEVIAIVLYTGPMFQIYNTILRQHPEEKFAIFRDGDNLFSTTIFVLVSAVQKLSRLTRIPWGTLLYRGLGGKLELPDNFFQVDEQGCSGYSEWGFLSTTSDRDVALGYSGVKERRPKAMVMVIETSSIDRGADISELSQYPGEREFLYLPCSFIQRSRHGNRRVEVVDGGLVTFYFVKVNLNIKTQTVEELQEQKKSMHLVSARSMLSEVQYILSEWRQSLCDQGVDPADVSEFVFENVNLCKRIIEAHSLRDLIDFADDEKFREMINEVLDTKAELNRTKDFWLTKWKHLQCAKSMKAEFNSYFSDWVKRHEQRGVDLPQHVGDVSKYRDRMMSEVQRVVANHAKRNLYDFADVENVRMLKSELNVEVAAVFDSLKWQDLILHKRLRSDTVETASCIWSLQGHSDTVWSVAFHPTAPLLATGSYDKTVKLWSLPSDDSLAICVSTLAGHDSAVLCVTFHPKGNFFATGSDDKTAKLWRLSSNSLSATCETTLDGHSDSVFCAAFHPTAPVLVTGSSDTTAKLWRLSPDCSSATCVSTLKGHSNSVYSVAFHPNAPYLASGSGDSTVKLWRLSSDNSSAICEDSLMGHSRSVFSVAFHPTAPVLVTGSGDKTAKLWRLSSNSLSGTCEATLKAHGNAIYFVSFHPTAPVLVTGSSDTTAKLWRLSPDCSSATCVSTLKGHSTSVSCAVYHPMTAFLATTGSTDNTAKVWR